MAEKFRALPIVEKVVMVEEFLPVDQDEKLAELGRLTDLVPRSINTGSDIGAPARSRMLEIISGNMTALAGTEDAPEDLKAAAARMKSAIEAFSNNRGSDDEAVKEAGEQPVFRVARASGRHQPPRDHVQGDHRLAG
jgi:hypothetical protein